MNLLILCNSNINATITKPKDKVVIIFKKLNLYTKANSVDIFWICSINLSNKKVLFS